jgi:hypothetical protein
MFFRKGYLPQEKWQALSAPSGCSKIVTGTEVFAGLFFRRFPIENPRKEFSLFRQADSLRGSVSKSNPAL